MKNKVKLAFMFQSRRKSTIFNIIFITIAVLIVLAINTYSDTAINFMNSEIYNSIYYQGLEVLTIGEKDRKVAREKLEEIEHVSIVTDFYNYNLRIGTDEFKNEKLEGDIQLYIGNNNTLPEIVLGTNFPDNEGNYLVCPENFYPTLNLNNLRTVSSKYAVDIDNYLNKNVTFNYKSNALTNDYEITYKIVGFYKNRNYLDSNLCYAQENTMNEIVMNSYSDDIDPVTGESNLNYQTSFFVQVDNIGNLEKVEEEITKLGYRFEENAEVVPEYFENIQNTSNNVSYIVIIVTAILLLIISYKQFAENKTIYTLLKYLGYKKESVISISFLSSLIQAIFSLFVAMLIFFIVYALFQLVLNIYPFLLNNWSICISFRSFISIIIVVLVIMLIGNVLNMYRIDDIYD